MQQIQITRQTLEDDFPLFARVVFNLIIKDFHKDWINLQTENAYTLLLAPRGWGKSEICDIAYTVWRIVKDRSITIAIISKTETAAKQILKKIKETLEYNEIVNHLWGSFSQKQGWTMRQITVSGRMKAIKDPTVYVTGAGGQMASYHFDIILVDDAAVEENSRTLEARESLITWFGNTVENATNPEHEIHVIGTRYHQEELYGHLIENGGYEVLITDCWVMDEDDNYESRWPEVWPKEKLLEKRKRIGERNFNLQFRNNADLVTGGVFRPEWIDDNRFDFHKDKDFKNEKDACLCYQSVDLAFGTKQSHDYFVVLTVLYNRGTKNFWVVDIDRKRYTPKQHLDVVLKNYNKWQPSKVIIESNNYQKAFCYMVQDTGIPVEARHTAKDKETRMFATQGFFEANQVHIPYGDKFEPIVEELKAFPSKYVHDDTCDALELIISHCKLSGFVGTLNFSPFDEVF